MTVEELVHRLTDLVERTGVEDGLRLVRELERRLCPKVGSEPSPQRVEPENLSVITMHGVTPSRGETWIPFRIQFELPLHLHVVELRFDLPRHDERDLELRFLVGPREVMRIPMPLSGARMAFHQLLAPNIFYAFDIRRLDGKPLIGDDRITLHLFHHAPGR